MKFFTLEWWQSGCEAAPEVFARYDAHLSAIQPQLPPALVEFQSAFTLHDSEVKRVFCDFDRKLLVLELDGWDMNLTHPIYYTLTFSGVSVFEQQFPKEREFEAELGDLGYWEFDISAKGTEVRMLFVSSAEFRVVFTDFAFHHVSTEA
ncbi:hypothetical protein [Zoogloea dura]|uniref:DUF4085 family protein n=1 Tax=Zoogloea dura TaxID=2728840 RepID=A0A848G9I3_9RHOO|nr:hypothetical protein [Zoogloea dura]NML28948.1 hypothetical protein [Zoogloea dura]